MVQDSASFVRFCTDCAVQIGHLSLLLLPTVDGVLVAHTVLFVRRVSATMV